jgi:hypothetical protein
MKLVKKKTLGKRMGKFIDLTGQRFGRLKVVKFIERIKKKTIWLCYCDCGKKIKSHTSLLNAGKVRSCGCLKKELLIAKNTTHGLSGSSFYNIFNMMKKRCDCNNNSINKKYYSERGIEVCSYWENFENFKEDMYESYLMHVKEYGKKNTTIDRVDNNKGYSKENCRWATRKEQNRNKRNNIYAVYKGEKKTITEISLEMGGCKELIRHRLITGWSIEKAINTPVNKNYQQNASKNKFYVVCKGEKKTKTEISLELGGCRDLVRARLKQDWSLEKAISTPANKNYQHNKK